VKFPIGVTAVPTKSSPHLTPQEAGGRDSCKDARGAPLPGSCIGSRPVE
jgi:hypothetical protein